MERKIAVGMTRCGWCGTNQHESCKGAGRNGSNAPKPLWKCGCTDERCESNRNNPHCLECGNTHSVDVDPDTWSCIDQEACHNRTARRLDDNPLVQRVRQARESAAMADTQKAEKAKTEKTPKVGTCLVTGKPTKGGKFLPGMDARYVSLKVASVMDGSAKEADVLKEMTGHGLSDSLKGKFTKGLKIARDKAAAAKAAEAEKAKADKAKVAASNKG